MMMEEESYLMKSYNRDDILNNVGDLSGVQFKRKINENVFSINEQSTNRQDGADTFTCEKRPSLVSRCTGEIRCPINNKRYLDTTRTYMTDANERQIEIQRYNTLLSAENTLPLNQRYTRASFAVTNNINNININGRKRKQHFQNGSCKKQRKMTTFTDHSIDRLLSKNRPPK